MTRSQEKSQVLTEKLVSLTAPMVHAHLMSPQEPLLKENASFKQKTAKSTVFLYAKEWILVTAHPVLHALLSKDKVSVFTLMELMLPQLILI